MSLWALMFYFRAWNYSVIFTIGLCFFAVLKTEVITSAYLLSRRWKLLKVLFFIAWAIFLFLSVVNFFSVEMYGFGISYRLINVVRQTSLQEISGFLPGMLHNLCVLFFSFRFLICLVAGMIFYYIVKRCPDFVFNVLMLVFSVVGLGYFGLYISSYEYNRMNHFIVPTTGIVCKTVLDSEREFRQWVGKIKPLPCEETVESVERPNNLLLIIGESASRAHHGLYGYPLPTTPRLVSMRDSLMIYRDVIGSGVSTGGCVPKILTFEKDTPHEEQWNAFPSSFQVFNAAGYNTYWISNQERTGDTFGTYHFIVTQARDIKYVGIDHVNDHLTARYDDAVLPEIARAVADSSNRKFIGVHLFGSHTKYADRFPLDRAKFKAEDVRAFNHKKWVGSKEAQTIADYDNSILYTDSILAETISLISDISEPYVMIYVVDHGENVFDDRDFIGRDAKFVDVPMFIYMNKAYRELNPEVCEMVTRSLHRRISSSMLIHAMLTLTGVKYVMYEPAEDFLSDSFVQRIRYASDYPYYAD